MLPMRLPPSASVRNQNPCPGPLAGRETPGVGVPYLVPMSEPAPAEPWTAIKVVMMPRDANPIPEVVPGFGPSGVFRTIFGGVILSHLDQAGALAARRELQLRGGNKSAIFVTVAINRVEFKQPVRVGDVVSFRTRVTRLGRTSITVHIDVHAERGADVIHVTEAEGVFVAVDATTPDRRPVPLFPGDRGQESGIRSLATDEAPDL